MSNEQKVCCGGFFIGDGLEMDGKTLKALGGGSDGYSYYFVNCKTSQPPPDHIPTLMSIDETFAQMQENIANHKIPILYDDEYYLYYLTAHDEWALEFTSFYAYSVNGAKDIRGVSITSPQARTLEIYEDSWVLNYNQTHYESITVTCKETDGVFNLINIGGEGLNRLHNVNVNIILQATFADNHTVVASYSKRENNYAYFTAVNVTDTGVHYDYFKIRTNSAGTITYTSKDITI